MESKKLLKILFAEDLPSDAELAVMELRKDGLKFDYLRVDTRHEFSSALSEFHPDIVISDYIMPSFNGLQALKDCREKDPLMPFILFTGSTNEEIAVKCMKAGATDYVIKEHMTRLPFAVKEALDQVRIQKEKLTSEHLLEESHRSLNTLISNLQGIVYRCRNDKNWTMEFMSEGTRDLTGYSPEELIRNSEISYNEIIHKDDRKYIWDEVQKALNERKHFQIQYRIVKKNDEICWVWEKGEGVFSENGELIFLEGFITDITNQKLAQDSLRESQQRFETLAMTAPVGIFRTREDGYTTYVNPKWMELSGLSSDEALGFGWLKAVHPDDLESVKERWKCDVESKKTSNAEYRFLRPDDTICWVIGSAIPELINNEIKGYIGTITDITERHLAEAELHKLSRAVEQSPVSIVITDTEGNIEYVNPKMCKITAYSYDDLIGKNPRILSSGEKNKSEYFNLWETIKGGNDWTGEFHNRKKNGELYWESATISPIRNDKNEITHFLGIKEDISEKKRSEQIQKALFVISSAVVTTSNIEVLIEVIKQQIGTIIDSRNFFLAFYDETTGTLSSPYTNDEKDDFDTWPAEKSLTYHVIKHNKSVLLNKEDILKMVKEGIIEMVGTVAECWLGVPLAIGEKVYGAFVVQSYETPDAYNIRDVDMLEFIANQISQSIQRQEAITSLKGALLKAEAGDRLKTTFLNNISHEVRTPLNGILGFAELISRKDISEKDRRDSLFMLNESSDRLLNTITNYMDISMLTSATLSVHNKDFYPSQILKDLFNKYNSQCIKRNLEFKLDVPSQSESISLHSDPELFRKIICHLLDNALKFTERGSITYGFQKNDKDIEFYVKDTGIGISSESINNIFERFIKEDRGLLKTSEGSGLGLSIAKGMSDLIGGNISLKSEIGVGSVFLFKVPLKKRTINFPSEISGKNSRKSARDSQILVAEDDEVNYFYLNALLTTGTNHNILHAKNGREAIKLFKANPGIVLILMDIKMPETDGIEAIRQIRLISKDIPIIAVTAYAMLGDEEKILAAGCDGYLSKPINRNSLMKTISKFIEI
jgi:PAS domain S-box-containing protein